MRQSRAEEKVLGNKGVARVARPPEAQPSLDPPGTTGTKGVSVEDQGEDLVEI